MEMVATAGINQMISESEEFSASVVDALVRFIGRDWGNVCEEDWESNDRGADSLKEEGFGFVLAAYESPHLDFGDGFGNPFWIIKDPQAITVLFPDEY